MCTRGNANWLIYALRQLKYTDENPVERIVWDLCMPIIMITMMTTVNKITVANQHLAACDDDSNE